MDSSHAAERIRTFIHEHAFVGEDETPVYEALDALLVALRQAEADRDLALEEIRIREQSQIPVIPRGAQAQIGRLEEQLARAEADRDHWQRELASLRDSGSSSGRTPGFDPGDAGSTPAPEIRLRRALDASGVAYSSYADEISATLEELVAERVRLEADCLRLEAELQDANQKIGLLQTALRDAAWLIECYEAIEYGKPVRNMDEAVSAWSRGREALSAGGVPGSTGGPE